MSKTILMIHGMCGGGWYWDRYRSILAQAGYTCLAPDLPMHDTNVSQPVHPNLGATSILDYVTALETQIATLDQPPILMGHSMGGLLAQILASRGLAKAVVLLTPASPAGIVALMPSVLRTFFPVTSRWNFWNKPFTMSQATIDYAILNQTPKAERDTLYPRMGHESGRAAFEIGFWPFDQQHATRVNAADVRCPMLVIGAGKDRITPASVVRQVAAKYPQANYREYHNNGHWVVGEPNWQDIVTDIVGWLKINVPD
jgi:pimeloyl-ACP methyl ester carboxylesterase